MKALILAAGIGKRLKLKTPKILLKIGNKTLLERHYENLKKFGIKDIGIVIGYKFSEVKKYIEKIDKNIKIFKNEKYLLGSIVSLVKTSNFFKKKDSLLLMDGDVLYDSKILKKLITSKKNNCLLLDPIFDAGDEPVKVIIKNNKICDFGKRYYTTFDYIGESVGFFKFDHKSSLKFLNLAKKIMRINNKEMYEEVIREIIKNKIFKIGFEYVGNLPWIEIDFKKDLNSAKRIISKRINE